MSDPNANPYANPPASAPLDPLQEKQCALLTHLLSIFFGFVSALVMFLLFKDRGSFVRAHVVTEWNFQLTALIAQAVPFVLAIIGWGIAVASAIAGSGPHHGVSPILPIGVAIFLIGYVLVIAVAITRLVFGIIASVAANRGQFYRYRVAIRFVRA